ncbi:MAG: hypothetical protein HUJ26_19525 [Planctomycetaceae bacterium]|nr:hypothetical protein [Planctomycetaceae bacterium]
MNVSELTVRLLLLFFPGIICHIVVEWFTVHRERKPHQVFLLCFVYGMLAYCLYHAASQILRIPTLTMDVLNFSNESSRNDKETQVIKGWEIFAVTCAGVFLGLAFSFIHKKKWAHRLALACGITAKFGELDVWEYALASPDTEWVVLRDHKNGLMYQGQVLTFSDNEEEREIILKQVNVFDEKSGDFRFEVDKIYISRRKDDMTLEFQNPEGD